MNIESIKQKLKKQSIFHSEGKIQGNPTVIGYEKKFKLIWMATQLNTFIIATDFGDEKINTKIIKEQLTKSFAFAKKNYTGWPRGLQSGVGVICILISTDTTETAKGYCRKLKADKQWAGFSIPVIYNSKTKEYFYFQNNPMWGAIYFPHFKRLIQGLK